MSKIYTRKGDDGSTGLVTGERVLKSAPRVELYGTSDELNSHIGAAIAALPDRPEAAGLREQLTVQQNLLFELGAELAGFVAEPGKSALLAEDITQLEAWMDAMSEQLEPMRAFILPGGTQASALLHVCRTVCRRLERQMVEVARGELQNQDEAGNEIVLAEPLRYINRLSDYLFLAARYANLVEGRGDVKWASRAKQMQRDSS